MSNSKLFTPLSVGPYKLSHRIAMAPLTRFRATSEHVPTPLVAEYYSQRAAVAGTLLVTEATFVSPRAAGFANIPGIWTPEQIEGWKLITSAVHKKGSYIFMQIWALGRAANPATLKQEFNLPVISSSSVPMEGGAVPRALTIPEIQSFIADFAQAAKNAIAAGFDGVEIHGANGYLIDQFIQSVANKRTDSYGGSIENRSRFAFEVTKAVVDAIGPERVGLRLSPFSTFQSMKMPADEIEPQFLHLIRSLRPLHLAYLHLVESRVAGIADVEATEKIDPFIDAWGNTSPILLAGGFKPDSARKAVDEDYKDKNVVVVFGRFFIANPDLVFRLREGLALTQYNRETFYKVESPEGYTDYPFSDKYLTSNAAAKA
ncbi:MAG: hypothetical protein M1834_007512 [Cirrosporium novae-zelandiae]|nr:MAG: hypothetical protein M1834_007512 [Cirrosporium novae-zelandiae]